MSILVTGATGKVGKALVKRLIASKQPTVVATRSGTFDGPCKAVKFDWNDESTYGAPFKADPTIEKLFLIQPEVFDPLAIAKPFLELAIAKGVKRIVFVSSSTLEKGAFVNGKIHEYLADSGVDYCVLRPTTFTENFGATFRYSILERNSIISASGKGKAAFVSVEDIAQAALEALVAEKSPNNDLIIVGPQLYTFDEVAQLLSNVIGRTITHNNVSVEEYVQTLKNFGMEEKYAGMLGFIQTKYADGSEEAITKIPGVYVGTHTVLDYFKENKDLWVNA